MASPHNNNHDVPSSSQKISSSPTTNKDAKEKLQSSERPRNFSVIIVSDSTTSPLEDTNKATLPEGTSSLKGATSATQTTTSLVESQTQNLQYKKSIQDVESQKDLTVEVNEEYGHCVGSSNPQGQEPKTQRQLFKKDRLGLAQNGLRGLLVHRRQSHACQGGLFTSGPKNHDFATQTNDFRQRTPHASGEVAIWDLCEKIWFPHIHRTIVQLFENCRKCTE